MVRAGQWCACRTTSVTTYESRAREGLPSYVSSSAHRAVPPVRPRGTYERGSQPRPFAPEAAATRMAVAARDTFTADFDEARRLADDAFVLLNERRDQLQQNADASVARLTAASRRKLNALGSKVASLEAAIGDESQAVSAKERDRRRDMVARLKTHSAQLTELLARKDAPARAAGGAAAGAGVADERPRETLETAERDELGLLVLQRDVIAAQDAQLDDLSRTVTSVRHIACAVNEELDLQSRLLVRARPRRGQRGAPARKPRRSLAPDAFRW